MLVVSAGSMGAVVLALCLESAGVAFGQGPVLGPESMLSDPEDGDVGAASIASLSERGHVVLWTHVSDSTVSVRGRRVDRDGLATGEVFAVNEEGDLGGSRARVAADGAGGFVVVWQAFAGQIEFILARRFGIDATPMGPSLFVHGSFYVSGGPSDSDVAVGLDGRFVVAWVEDRGVFARRFTAGGTPDTAFRVDADALRLNRDVSVGMDGVGNFVVVWDVTDSPFHHGPGIVARRYDAVGHARGPTFSVSNEDCEACTFSERLDQTSPDVAVAPSGEFVVAWTLSGYDQFGSGCYNPKTVVATRRFDADGAPLDDTPRISGGERDLAPAVTATGDPRFVVVWHSTQYGCLDDHEECECGERSAVRSLVDADVSTRTERMPLGRGRADVAGAPDGAYVIVWTDFDVPAGPAVVARRVSPAPPTPPACGRAAGVAALRAGTAGAVDAAGAAGTMGTVATAAATPPSAADALAALLAVVGRRSCAACVCDGDSSGTITASDALLILQAAVGADVVLRCPPCD